MSEQPPRRRSLFDDLDRDEAGEAGPFGASEVPVGEILRRAREERDIRLADVAEHLRIREAYLDAIERGDEAGMPGLTYALGFVRSYADLLGFDGEAAVRRFKAERAGEQQAELSFPEPVAESRIPKGAILFVSVVLAAAAYGGWYYLNSRNVDVAELIPKVPERLARLVGGSDTTAPANEAAKGPANGFTPPGPGEGQAPGALTAAGPAKVPAPGPASSPSGQTQASAPTTPVTPAAPAGKGSTAPSTAEAQAPGPAASSPSGQKKAALSAQSVPKPVPKAADAPVPKPVPVPKVAPRAAEAPTPKVAETPPASPEAAKPASKATATPAPSNPPASPPTPATGSAGKAVPPSVPAAKTPENPASAASPAQAANGSGSGANVAPAPVRTADAEGNASSVPKIVIRATADSWIQVRGVGGATIVTRILRKGDSYTVPDRPGLRLMTGNAGALEILVNGKKAPSLGPFGAVRRDIALNADDLLAGGGTRVNP